MSETDKRTEWVDGLRQLADFVESHPELPLPHCGAAVYLWGPDVKVRLAEAAAVLGTASKEADGNYIGVTRKFGPISLSVKAWRDSVCTRVVVGTKTVTFNVPPEGVEMLEQTRTEEIVEWVCPPSLLAMANADAEAVA